MSTDSADISPTAPRAPGVVVIVAAYNEAPRIEATLGALAAAFPGAPLWVADDGSTDATAQIARRAGARVVRSERMIGKGGAATLAAREALEDARSDSGEPIFILCDGDLAESARAAWARLPMPCGRRAPTWRSRSSPRVSEGGSASRSDSRAGRSADGAAWQLRAPISGQRALRASVLEDVLPFARGFGMEIGMTIDAARAGHRIAEVELDLSHRATGRTLSGFLHRGRQLVDFVRVYLAR